MLKVKLFEAFPDQIHSLRLFGSKARGDATKFSDVDVLVILERGDWQDRHAIIRIAAEISGETGTDLSPKVFTREQIESMRRRRNVFLQSVDQSSIEI